MHDVSTPEQDKAGGGYMMDDDDVAGASEGDRQQDEW